VFNQNEFQQNMFKSKTCFSKTVAVSAKRLLFQQNGSQTYVMFQQNIECFSKKQKVFRQYHFQQTAKFQQTFNGFVI
jgi:hypothetical protein